MVQCSAGRRIRVAVTIANLTRFHKCRHIGADARPPETLSNATQRGLVSVVRGLVEGTKYFFAEDSGDHDARRNCALI